MRIGIIQTADAPAADLLLLPELALCGYQHQDAIRRMARARRHALVFGYAESDGEARYNAMMAIDAQGNVCANYRKLHLWSGYEQALFRTGDRLTGFSLRGFRFGMAICYDLDFPELVRAQALTGMDCLLCISATTSGYDVVPRHVVPARAYENGCYIAFANRGDGDGAFACIG
ncbi:nitrilase-related carbon-nitrogen hydrolase [Sodalis glossinidius]|uniref:nitrilase-related carbon-nitrogen hydrolase n=1 Tax=Sodalis glossinidius TaxID=63612 RepID=UPI0002D9A38C|nr:nitrilase-related carbon-nitrogen hydrolase [Sodalis glossinidius]